MSSVSALVRVRNSAISTFVLAAALGIADGADARNRVRDAEEPQQVTQQQLSGRPVVAVVSIKNQRISVYDANGDAMRAPISSR
ncbi:MAG: L,D-transpeptidase, partial [Hyphomicrobium denitrificans]|nr:L,D-transpeptidase [Hyphomicrobium denitrificans]